MLMHGRDSRRPDFFALGHFLTLGDDSGRLGHIIILKHAYLLMFSDRKWDSIVELVPKWNSSLSLWLSSCFLKYLTTPTSQASLRA
jgi:hypothetical protein